MKHYYVLPTLHKELANEVLANAIIFPHLDVSEQDIPTTRWLLSRLHLYFENQLEAQCRHRCYGTLLFHKRCDLVQALSMALGKNEYVDDSEEDLEVYDDEAVNNIMDFVFNWGRK